MASTLPATNLTPFCAPQNRFHSLTGIQIAATGGYVPEGVVTNEDLRKLGYDADWIFRRTGIRERRHAQLGTTTSDLALEAAHRCLSNARVDARDLDLILVATSTPDSAMPSTACHLQRRLGSTAPALDLNAACAGFMYALTTGAQFVKTGHSRCVLVVGAEIMSRIVNPRDYKTYPLFGDGAGAVLLTRGEASQGLLAYTLGADGTGADLLYVPGGGVREPLSLEVLAGNRQFIHMDGRAVYKWAVSTLVEIINATLRRARVSVADLHLLVLHQANIRIIDSAVAALCIDPSKVVVNLDRYGNTSAASIPLALDEAGASGRLHRGDNIIVCGFGAGLTWGCALVKW